MKVLDLSSIKGTEREVRGKGFTSFRFLLESDEMGFSIHKTVIPKGDTLHWHYTRHLEACYCVSGLGILTDLSNGREYAIRPDTLYALDNHDDHWFRAEEDTILISIFNPPCKGNEIHQADGSYA